MIAGLRCKLADQFDYNTAIKSVFETSMCNFLLYKFLTAFKSMASVEDWLVVNA